MAAHDHHPSLPNYDSRFVLQDGCEECERRSADGLAGLLELDHENLPRIFDLAERRMAGGSVLASRCDLRLMKVAESIFMIAARLPIGVLE